MTNLPSEPVRRPSRPPVLGLGRILANALSRHEGRGELVARAARELGDVFRLPTPGRNIYFATHPRDLRHVMIQNAVNYRKSFDYDFLARLLGQGLITSEGELWLRDRRLQQPLFQGKALDQFFGTIVRCAESALSSWKPGREFSLEPEMARFTLHVIGERILSLDVRPWSEEIRHHLDVCQAQIINRGLAIVDLARWLPTPGERRFKRSLRDLFAIVDRLIDERRRRTDDPYDLFSILDKNADGKLRLRDQMITLFLAGHETSALALMWTFYNLSHHPEIDARVAAEAASVLQGQTPTQESPGRLVYTTQVINESMRLYPPVASMGREALGDDVLGGYPVRKGTIVVLCPFAVHRRPDLWPDPEKFDPSRFTEENRKAQLPGAFIPFILGPRGCIGQHLAMWELQLAISMITERFRLRLVNPERVRADPLISLKPSRPIVVRVESRNGQAGVDG